MNFTNLFRRAGIGVNDAAVLDVAARADLDGLVVRVCSLEHLIQMKRSSERARDREDLAALEAVQKEDREGK